jgi:hypothetical protein
MISAINEPLILQDAAAYRFCRVSVSTILWRRLDTPGHDACRLVEQDNGWRLEGAAAFREEGAVSCVHYRIHCDRQWRTQEGIVRGWAGARSLDSRITRSSDGMWRLNEQLIPDLNGCVDLDFGFTPATNLFQIRRVALRVGESANVPVAWFDTPAGALELLHQRYERVSETTYWYESPRFGYSALLDVNPVGFVEKYPELWEAERQVESV